MTLREKIEDAMLKGFTIKFSPLSIDITQIKVESGNGKDKKANYRTYMNLNVFKNPDQELIEIIDELLTAHKS